MCLMVYLAASRPLPLIPLEANAAITVRELDAREQGVAQWFSQPFVYYVGAYEGCGCGFNYGRYPIENESDQEQYAASRQSVQQLAAYLAQALEQAAELELFVCWDGDQGQAPHTRAVLTPADLGGEVFGFEPQSFIRVRRGDDQNP